MTLSTPQASQRAGRYIADGVIQVEGLLDSSEIETIRTAFMEQVARDRHSLAAADGLAEDDVLARFPRFMQPHRAPDLAVGSSRAG
ncbi:hypothetical protein ACIQ9R_15015 [Streptomyces sp. NPDC094447]|uniref:hypothetical protein n=1 Tax=Streptomyces sp. NPDC094447 TaxID=3366062 RepID=UPI0037FAAB47